MEKAYPIVITKTDDKVPYSVYVPDFDAYTQGTSVADAMVMARDLIGVSALSLKEDLQQDIPEPLSHQFASSNDDIVTLVDIDFDEYKRSIDTTPVKKTLSIPAYLNRLGIEKGINFSATLTDALSQKLGI